MFILFWDTYTNEHTFINTYINNLYKFLQKGGLLVSARVTGPVSGRLLPTVPVPARLFFLFF